MMQYTFDADFSSVAKRLAEATRERNKADSQRRYSERGDRQSAWQSSPDLGGNLEQRDTHRCLRPRGGNVTPVMTQLSARWGGLNGAHAQSVCT